VKLQRFKDRRLSLLAICIDEYAGIVTEQVFNGTFSFKNFSEHPTNNRRHRVYHGKIEGVPKLFFLKQQVARPEYPTLRRVELLFKQLLFDNGEKGFKGALLLEDAEIPTAKVYAFWTSRWFRFQSDRYTLYEDISDAKELGLHLQSGDERRERILQEIGKLAISLHRKRLHHRDFNLNNLMIRDRDGDAFELLLIDADAVCKQWIKIPIVDSLFALRIFRRLKVSDGDMSQILFGYLGKSPTQFTLKIVRFWRSPYSRPRRLFSRSLRSMLRNFSSSDRSQPKDAVLQPKVVCSEYVD
jgi:hypothetical protein